jgi:alpha-D-xyloside xylohydrolase
MRKMRIFLLLIVLCGAQMAFGQLTFTKDSVSVKAVISSSRTLYVKVCSPTVIRVAYVAGTTIPADTANYIVVKGTWSPVTWSTSETSTTYSITTSALRVDIAKTNGTVSFFTAGGTAILNEVANAKQLNATTVSGYSAYAGALEFNGTSDEGLYGFGQFQSGILNQRGQTLTLSQQNTTDCSPFFMSTRGFGILWVNYSVMNLTPPIKLSCKWATNDAIDYYFMYGPEFDQIISGYRTITGQARMWPKWAYGFWQCRNYYASQNEILNVVKKYRSKNYPIDNIVQDWQYYPAGKNGCECFEATRYPDPKGMIKTLHDSLNCHFTMSVWPSFTATAGNTNYEFMNSRGYLLSVSDYLGRTYDPFNDSAAFYYWKCINDSLVTKDVDGFWPDATEPESAGWSACMTAQGPATKVENIFPLLHSKTLYDGYRKANNDRKRVCNLTRSYYAGSQRLGAAYWTGDIGTSFDTYNKQIPAGLNISMTGLPLFCTDVGGFSGTNTSELETRWFQWGAFNPVFRVHGTRACNEVWCWNDATGGNLSPNPKTESILANYLNLRYRLFPYVYSLAGKVTQDDYTMMRALPFEFRNDMTARNMATEFMFGPALLVCPVSTEGVTSLQVYLPSATWYNFWTGDSIASLGKTITTRAPLDTMPIFVRAGSIVPMGPEIKYANALADPIELRVYTGADGAFTLYEDQGDNYDYEKGVFSTIPITWNEASQTLTIGPTTGTFPGWLQYRTFNIVWVSRGHGVGESVTAAGSIDKIIAYNGGALSLNKTTGQIGVKYFPEKIKAADFSLSLDKKSLFACLGGKGLWQVRVITLSGKTVATKIMNGGVRSMIANRLSSGAYVVNFMYNGFIVANKKVLVP